ncbi:hypothetical protein KI688_001674 [Linnemannia hyalina]|uniref:Cas12f1-like TNB domain-containing protein n=1 Tax=Linnemannia hyalina TaxID=64524 RepID=A0A9P7XUH6_9FUNG|nr:hypothetical protein KI688_001674 [Linnemannia hyalina]
MATVSCERSLDELERRIDNNVSIRKRQFTEVRTSLGRMFYWSLPARQAFIAYMVQAGWTVRACETEADPTVALDCQPGGVVVSADSDMLAYSSICTLWRPSRKVCSWYTSSRTFVGALDPKSIVSAYLTNRQVLSKNTVNQTFELALRVFVDLEQTPIDYDVSAICLAYNELCKRFTDLCTRHEIFKKRCQTVDQKNAPKDQIQYVLKHYKEPSETLTSPTSTEESKSKAVRASVSNSKPPAKMDKKGLVYSLSWYHPISALSVGTLRKNVERVLLNLMNTTPKVALPTDLDGLQQEVVDCIEEATRLAAGVKREGQQLIGQFVETLRDRMTAAEQHKRTELAEGMEPRAMTEQERLKARREAITESERTILSYLCEPAKAKDADDDQDDVDGDKNVDADSLDIDGQESDQKQLLWSFLTYLYSGNRPVEETKSIVTSVNMLIESSRVLGFHETSRRSGDRVIMPFTPNSLVRSAAGQLAVELKLMYGHGTHALFEKGFESGRLGEAIDIRIQEDLSAVENFLFLNDLTNSGCWERGSLKAKLIQLADSDGSTISSTTDLEAWLGSIHPGFLIKHFICDVAPQGLTSRQRGKVGHRAAVKLVTLPQIRTHLGTVKNEWLDPVTYAEKGYILRGSVRTGGFRVQLLAFKLRELQDVRYRRLDEDRLSAVYQPSFKFRRWLESEKKATQEGEQETIEDIETRLPPLEGQGASVVDYVAELKEVENRLLEFYGGRDQQYKRHKWDMERARHYEYQLIADRLLGIVGGSIGRPRDPSNAVLIGARSLGYIVVGQNEYYTSKKCPHCGLFVAQVTLRRLFCPHCHVYHHRDVMAAENMANIIQGYLIDQERPEYLQPVASDGSLPWKKAQALVGFAPCPIEATTSGGSTTTTSQTPGRQKRAASASSSSGRGKAARL